MFALALHTEVLDTEVPDTEVPDTEVPDTEVPDTEVPGGRHRAAGPSLAVPGHVGNAAGNYLRRSTGHSGPPSRCTGWPCVAPGFTSESACGPPGAEPAA